jgi:chemotaxis signal transduction protein
VEQDTAPSSLAVLTFGVGPFLLGTEAGQVARLVRPSFRGRDQIPVVDLRRRCGLEPLVGAADARGQLVVVAGTTGEVAYLVDQVGEIITVDLARQVWSLPPLIERQKRWPQLWGVCEWRDELVLLVDLAWEEA